MCVKSGVSCYGKVSEWPDATVARLMAVMGLAGVLRGKKVRTTISRKAVAAGDRVNRQFVAERPDQLWVADFTYVSTWRGFVYVAFIH
ncbi:transposase [Escherichia coli]|uniref:Transposase n=1 Tax=Escherichia coli TaxID=562 RepID=A0A377D460_ECOLX|nr:transposase [Escherichia coli]